ncbi:MAG TPA: hypothetical protein PLU22_01680 [Polyangiaceae bacterium]|nr:hypothetical protein [Polyangiaceae bacterium]
MAGKKKKQQAAAPELVERRFVPGRAQTSTAAFVVGGLGAAALGAGVWGRFLSDPPFAQALYLLVPGAAALAGAVVWGSEIGPVRVGDAGVVLEANAEAVRLPWCDVERVRISGGNLLVVGKQVTITIPIGAHRQAAAWVLAEAQRRLPRIVDVKGSAADALPKPSEDAGELRKIEDLQVAGRHCAESEQPITFEGDARVCPNCAQIYHRSHVPERCRTCERKLGSRALPVPAT